MLNNYCSPGVGYSLNDVFSWVRENAAAGSQSAGTISEALVNAGLTIEAARAMLNTIATQVGADPQQVALVSAELNYLNNGGAPGGSVYAQAQGSKSWLPVVIGVGVLYLLLRREP